MDSDPTYVESLENLPEARRKAMLYGDEVFSEYDMNINTPESIRVLQGEDFFNDYPYKTRFPRLLPVFIENVYRSQWFKVDSEMSIKRMRNIMLNIFSKANIDIELLMATHEGIDTGIIYDHDNIVSLGIQNIIPYLFEYRFDPTIDFYDHIRPLQHVGTQNNILTIVPDNNYMHQRNNSVTHNDKNYKPIKMAVDIYSRNRTLINAMMYNFREIWGYLR
jgi:hypothetical protein